MTPHTARLLHREGEKEGRREGEGMRKEREERGACEVVHLLMGRGGDVLEGGVRDSGTVGCEAVDFVPIAHR